MPIENNIFNDLLNHQDDQHNDTSEKNIDPNLNQDQNINTDTIDPDIKDNSNEDSFIFKFLKEKGIEDPSKIKFETEDGNTEDVDFNTLSVDEQLNILKELTDNDINDHEQAVINYLRTNNLTFDKAVDYLAEKKLEEYLKIHPEENLKTYTIDDYSDEELYVADLKSKFPSLSDDELELELNKSMENEELFVKKINALRESYKQAEEQELLSQKQKEEQDFIDFKNSLTKATSNFNNISLDYTDPKSDSLVVEDRDKEEIINYLLDQDNNGKSKFLYDLDNPETVVQLAWFMTKGKDAISEISKYWKDTLKNERKELTRLQKEIETLKSQSNKGNNVTITSKNTINDDVPHMSSVWSKSDLLK